jgi:hypothetical protein
MAAAALQARLASEVVAPAEQGGTSTFIFY